jgi:pimeloyl-ACP methyl ester carboxylesterase
MLLQRALRVQMHRRRLSARCLSTREPKLPPSCVWRPCPFDDRSDAAPLVIVFGFTSSTQKQLAKYAKVYHALGLDAITWACPPREVLRPESSRDTAARLLDALHDDTLIHRNIVLNGLSAGAYSVGNTLLELDARGGRDAFYDRIQSAVYDCPVDFDGVPKGVSSAMLGEGTPLQKLGESAIRLYLSAVDTEKWESSSAMFHAMPPAPPSLWIYSLNDEILDIPSIEKMIAKWRRRGDDVQTLVLDESPHVKNLLTAPDAYYDAVRRRVGDFRSNSNS